MYIPVEASMTAEYHRRCPFRHDLTMYIYPNLISVKHSESLKPLEDFMVSDKSSSFYQPFQQKVYNGGDSI